MSGSATIHHSNTGYQPDSEMDMSGRFVPMVDLTHDDDGTNVHMSEIPLQLPASAHASPYNSAVVTFPHAEGNLMRNVDSLHPVPNQTGVNPWQLQYPITYPQSVPAVLGPQEVVQLEALNDLRETARHALLHQQGEFLDATHPYEAAARHHLVSTLARNREAKCSPL